MKIAVVRPGIHSVDIEYCTSLAGEQNDVVLIAPRNTVASGGAASEDLPFQVKLLQKYEIIKGFPLVFGLFNYLIKFSPDVVQPAEEYNYISWISALYCLLFKKKLVLTQEKYFYSRFKKFELILKTIDFLGISKIVWAISKGVVSHGSETSKFILSRGCPANKITLINVGINSKNYTRYKTEYLSTIPIKVLCIARLIPHKGLFTLLEIAKSIGNKYVFTIIGDGPLKEVLEIKIKNDSIKNVQIMAPMPHSKIVSLFENFEIYICTSIYENSSQAVVEAMACGLPVIVSDVGSTKDFVVDDSGFICKSEDINVFKSRLLLLQDKELREKMGKNARNVAKTKFDWSNLIKNYTKIFNENT